MLRSRFAGKRLFQPLLQERDRARPCLLHGLPVRPLALILVAEEAVAGALVDVRLVGLLELLHLGLRRRDRRRDARVVAAVEAHDRRAHRCQTRRVGRAFHVRTRPRHSKRPRLRGGVRRSSVIRTPAEATRDSGALSIGRGKLRRPVADRIQSRRGLLRRQLAHELRHGVAAARRLGASAVRAVAGDQVRRDGDEALPGELIGDGPDPVGRLRRCWIKEDDTRPLLALRVDRPGAHRRPARDFHVRPFAVTGRFLELLLGLVVRRRQGGVARNQGGSRYRAAAGGEVSSPNGCAGETFARAPARERGRTRERRAGRKKECACSLSTRHSTKVVFPGCGSGGRLDGAPGDRADSRGGRVDAHGAFEGAVALARRDDAPPHRRGGPGVPRLRCRRGGRVRGGGRASGATASATRWYHRVPSGAGDGNVARRGRGGGQLGVAGAGRGRGAPRRSASRHGGDRRPSDRRLGEDWEPARRLAARSRPRCARALRIGVLRFSALPLRRRGSPRDPPRQCRPGGCSCDVPEWVDADRSFETRLIGLRRAAEGRRNP